MLAGSGHELARDNIRSLMYENTWVPSLIISERYEEKPDSDRLFCIYEIAGISATPVAKDKTEWVMSLARLRLYS
jgi:hypothetical protein